MGDQMEGRGQGQERAHSVRTYSAENAERCFSPGYDGSECFYDILSPNFPELSRNCLGGGGDATKCH